MKQCGGLTILAVLLSAALFGGCRENRESDRLAQEALLSAADLGGDWTARPPIPDSDPTAKGFFSVCSVRTSANLMFASRTEGAFFSQANFVLHAEDVDGCMKRLKDKASTLAWNSIPGSCSEGTLIFTESGAKGDVFRHAWIVIPTKVGIVGALNLYGVESEDAGQQVASAACQKILRLTSSPTP